MRFYKFVLLARSTSCTAFGRCEQELNREKSRKGIKKCKNSPQVVHSELLFFLRGASNLEAAAIDELCEPHNVRQIAKRLSLTHGQPPSRVRGVRTVYWSGGGIGAGDVGGVTAGDDGGAIGVGLRAGAAMGRGGGGAGVIFARISTSAASSLT